MTSKPSIEEVEGRLRALPSTWVMRRADHSALSRVDEIAWPRAAARRRTFVSPRLAMPLVAGLLLVALLNVVVVYFAPRYGNALADAPGIGPISSRLLSAVGLDGVGVRALDDSSTSSDHTLKLVGGYADGLTTVLFVSIDGKGLTGDPKTYGTHPGDYGLSPNDIKMTDQFGHSYDFSGTFGPTDPSFEPLAWPASEVGARLTLHVTALEAIWLMGTGKDSIIRGDWTLHATLASEPAHAITLPQPVTTERAVYTFVSVSASATLLVMHWTVSGPSVDEVRSSPELGTPSSSGVMSDYFTPQVFDASGRVMQFSEWGYTWPKSGPALGEMTVYISGPGRYRIQFGGALAGVDDQRWLVVH